MCLQGVNTVSEQTAKIIDHLTLTQMTVTSYAGLTPNDFSNDFMVADKLFYVRIKS